MDVGTALGPDQARLAVTATRESQFCGVISRISGKHLPGHSVRLNEMHANSPARKTRRACRLFGIEQRSELRGTVFVINEMSQPYVNLAVR